MMTQTTCTQARTNLASLLDQAVANREVIIIQRRGAEDVALIAAAELTSLLERFTSCNRPAMRNDCSPHSVARNNVPFCRKR